MDITGTEQRNVSGVVGLTTITPEGFGAKGDGVYSAVTGDYTGTDDTAAIQAALDSLQVVGGRGTLRFDPNKVYVCSSVTSRTSLNRTLEIYGDDITLEGGGLLAFVGSHGANWRPLMIGGMGKLGSTGNIETQRCVDKAGYAVTASIAAGAKSVPVAAGNEAFFTAGDIVFLRTGQTLTTGTTEPDAELGIVASTSSGAVVLTRPLSKSYAQEYFLSGTAGMTSTAVTANAARYELVNVTDRVARRIRLDGVRVFNRSGALQMLSTWSCLDCDFGVNIVEYPNCGWGHRDSRDIRHDAKLNHNGTTNTGYGWHPSTGCTRYVGRVEQVSAGFNLVNLHEGLADHWLDVRARNLGGVGEAGAALNVHNRARNLFITADLDVGVSAQNAFHASDTGAVDNVRVNFLNRRGNVRDDTGNVRFSGSVEPSFLTSLRGAQIATRARGHHSTGVIALTGIVTFSKGLDLGTLPQYAVPFRVEVDVITAFNSGVSNRINVGYSGLTTAYVNQAIVSATGAQQIALGHAQVGSSLARRQTASRTVLVDYTGTGATTGEALVTLLYYIGARSD